MNSPPTDSVQQLLALGYEDPFDIAQRKAVEDRQRNGRRAEAEDLLASGQIHQAIERLGQLAEEFPNWPSPHLQLARIYVQERRYIDARRHLDWLTYHGYESAALALLRAKVELSERRFDAAIDQANYAKCLSDDTASADAILGEVHRRRGNLDAATTLFERALTARPTDSAALGGMAAIALRRGNYEEAVDYALAALEQNMVLPAVHYCLGVALMNLGQMPEARAALETAARLDPQHVAPYRWLARICEQRGEPAQAAQMRTDGRDRIRRRQRSTP